MEQTLGIDELIRKHYSKFLSTISISMMITRRAMIAVSTVTTSCSPQELIDAPLITTLLQC